METIRVGQLVERLIRLDKYDKVYCGGSPVADGPEPVAHAGKVDIDPAHTSAVSALRSEIEARNQVIAGLETKIESIKQSISDALLLIEDGEIFEGTFLLSQLRNP